MNLEKMTAEELAMVFNVNEATIKKLAKSEQIPYLHHKNRMYFNFDEILRHLRLMEEGTACVA